MPEGRSITGSCYSPPGELPGGHTQSYSLMNRRYDTSKIKDSLLYEKHRLAPYFIKCLSYQCSSSANESHFYSHRMMCGRRIHEGRPDLRTTLYKSRTRLPAINQYQTRDLRHGCQGSKSLTPIMEE